MGPTPDLATYQQAAQAIYAPQQTADETTAKASTASDIANEESLKGGVQTDYQTAINNLTTTTNQNVAKINQLYTTRLGGNFSGLQGNDLGSMFATASQNQATIESTRANALAGIATTETNDQNELNATLSSIASKYQGEEEDYADTNYGAAVKEYDTEQYQQEELALKQESIDAANARASAPSESATNASNLASLNAQYKAALTQKGAQGKDSYVSPTTYNAALRAYEGDGGTKAQFTAAFSGYANPNQKNVNPNDLYDL